MSKLDIERIRESVRAWLTGMPHLKSYIDLAQVEVTGDRVHVRVQMPQDGGRLHALSLIDLAAKLEEQHPCTVELRVTVERPSGEPEFVWPRED